MEDRLDAILHQVEADIEGVERKSQVGSGARADKRRTYRYQEGLVHDHVTGKSITLKAALSGQISKLW
jgi:protein subunit release factor A